MLVISGGSESSGGRDRNGTVKPQSSVGQSPAFTLSFVGFACLNAVAHGHCRPFDAAADGYVRQKVPLCWCCVHRSARARNRIHATIVGSAVGQDGRTTGLSLPSADSQRCLLEQVYGYFGVDPSDLAFVEAHGTGTKVGDPMEASALGKGLAQRRSQPLPIGSVKSNIGHLEPASGLAGVLKSILALNHGTLPATLHQNSPSPDIPFDELNLRVVAKNWPLPQRRGPSLAGVNSFGFAAPMHMSSYEVRTQQSALLIRAATTDRRYSFCALHRSASPFGRQFFSIGHPTSGSPTSSLAPPHTSAMLCPTVIICTADNRGDPVSPRALLGSGRSYGGAERPSTGYRSSRGVCISGNGSQWASDGPSSMARHPRFRDALKDVDGHFSKRQEGSLVDLLFADDIAPKLRRAIYAQPLLLALQIATVRSLEDLE